MVLHAFGQRLVPETRPDPVPGPGEVCIRVEACGVCRTDLHLVDGELGGATLPRIPGHEIIGIVERLGQGVQSPTEGTRAGVAWLARTCGSCFFCRSGRENLCDDALFTGFSRDGGFATHILTNAEFVFPLTKVANSIAASPLLCAGMIGWRSLKMVGDAHRLGIYGFGAAGHILAQVSCWQGREIYAFTRPGDSAAQTMALSLGAVWAGGSDMPPPRLLDAAIVFAPIGSLVVDALRATRKAGCVVCGGIHMSDIPSFPYRYLWGERRLISVANLTREDGREFLEIAQEVGVETRTSVYPLAKANEALDDLRAGRLQGAAVLVP